MDPTSRKRTLPNIITNKLENKTVEKKETSREESPPYSMTSYGAEAMSDDEEDPEYELYPIEMVEAIIQDQIDQGTNPPSNIFPPTPESLNGGDVFKFPEIPQSLPKKLSDVLPYIDDYQAVKVQHKMGQPGGSHDIQNRKMPTEYIPRLCAYWGDARRAAAGLAKKGRIFVDSSFDKVRMNVYKDLRDRLFVTRLHTTVQIVTSRNQLQFMDEPIVKKIYEDPDKVNSGIFPTEFIAPDCPYYTKLFDGLEFPEVKPKWFHKKAMDQIWVHIRASPKRNIHIIRNGVTVELFVWGRETKKTNIFKPREERGGNY